MIMNSVINNLTPRPSSSKFNSALKRTWMCSPICKQRFIQDKNEHGSQMLGMTLLWPTSSPTNTYLGSPLCRSHRGAEVLPCQVEPLLGLQYPFQLRGSPAQPMVCVPNWQLSKLFSLEMNQTRQLITQIEKQGKKHKIFSVTRVEDWLPCATGGGLGRQSLPTFNANGLYSEVSNKSVSAIVP